MLAVWPAGAAVAGPTQEDPGLAAAIETELNRVRADAGVRELNTAEGLVQAAAEHAGSMAQLGYFDHVSPDGSSHVKRITAYYRVGRPGTFGVGEVQLWSAYSMTPAEAVAYWLEGSPHRTQVLARRWHDVGVAVVDAPGAPGFFGGRDVVIAVVDFGWRS
jgi:uncharacterized protein YkwD